MLNFYAPRRYAAQPKTREVGLRDDMREDGHLLLKVNGYEFNLRLQVDQRDVRMWRVYRDGEPWVVDGKPLRGGLEKVWRAIQAEMVPVLGRRHWL